MTLSSNTAPLNRAQLRELLSRYRRENWDGIQTASWQRRIVEVYLDQDWTGFFKSIGASRLDGATLVLDVGSGVGSFVVACRKRDVRAFGVEPDRIGNGSQLTSLDIARRRLDASAFLNGVGERLPFADGVFDLVTLHQVLEHVANPGLVLRECLRVVRRGGTVYLNCPNYLHFWEPHYKLPWLPLMPKPLARGYLRLLGRDSVLLEQLTYTTHSRVRALVRDLGPDCDWMDVHAQHFRAKCRGEKEFGSWRGRVLRRLCQIPPLSDWTERMALKLHRFLDPGVEFLLVKSETSETCSTT